MAPVGPLLTPSSPIAESSSSAATRSPTDQPLPSQVSTQKQPKHGLGKFLNKFHIQLPPKAFPGPGVPGLSRNAHLGLDSPALTPSELSRDPSSIELSKYSESFTLDKPGTTVSANELDYRLRHDNSSTDSYFSSLQRSTVAKDIENPYFNKSRSGLENRTTTATFALPRDGSDSTSVLSTAASSTEEEDDDEDDYPEGGWEAWRVVLGSFCGLFPVFGLVNSLGAIQAYVSVNQLADKTESQVSWIFSVFIFIECFFTGQVGYLFDCYGPYYLSIAGTFFFTLGLFATSFCTEYYQFFLSFSVCNGIGAALLMTPEIAIVRHWFNQKAGLALGVATLSGSVAGVILPILIRSIFNSEKIGYAWGFRILALMSLVLLTLSIFLMKPRLKSSRDYKLSVTTIFDASSLKDWRFTWLCIGNFLGELGVINGLTFLTSYALAEGKSESMSYALLAMLNGTGMVGRVVPGIIADRFGRFNTLIVTAAMGSVTILAIWLPFGKYTAGLIAFSLAHGFCNGGIYSLAPVCCGQICRTKDYGKRYGTMYFLASFTILLGVPLSGSLIGDDGKNYTKLVIFNGAIYCGTAISLFLSRYCAVGFTWKKW